MFGKRRKLTICGCDRDKLCDLQVSLCNIMDDVMFTDEERDAIIKAVQIIERVSVGMSERGSVVFD